MNAADAIRTVLTEQRNQALDEAARYRSEVLVLQACVADLEAQLALALSLQPTAGASDASA